MEAEILDIGGEVHDYEKEARQLGTSVENIVKSLVFIVDEEPVLVVVPVSCRVDEELVADELEADDARLASPEEVEEVTGYEVGEVPPVSLPLRKIVEERILEKIEVYGGGGTRDALLKIDPRYIVDEDTVVAEVVE
jgi:prolyl-tRNA editing enzyme YbaK/EbsC (Cys-tRNA(Pro) deacylase)